MQTTTEGKKQAQTHIPDDSLFYDRIVPLLLIGMAVIMAILILVAVGVLLGIVPFL